MFSGLSFAERNCTLDSVVISIRVNSSFRLWSIHHAREVWQEISQAQQVLQLFLIGRSLVKLLEVQTRVLLLKLLVLPLGSLEVQVSKWIDIHRVVQASEVDQLE